MFKIADCLKYKFNYQWTFKMVLISERNFIILMHYTMLYILIKVGKRSTMTHKMELILHERKAVINAIETFMWRRKLMLKKFKCSEEISINNFKIKEIADFIEIQENITKNRVLCFQFV